MTSENLANWAFAYVLVGTVIWMLVRRPVGPGVSRYAIFTASVGTIVAWPVVVFAIVSGCLRKARS